MIKTVKFLNWFIVGYYAIVIAISLTSHWRPIAEAKSFFDILFAVVAIALLAWQALIVRARFQDPLDEASLPFYERIEPGDWWRVFWILLLGHIQLASHYVWGFWLFSGVAIVLIIALVYTACIEYYRRRTVTTLLVGCLLFAFFLLAWEKNTYVVHYGVPIIGHFLEKPEYDTKYGVEVKSENSNVGRNAIADIHVGGRTETEDAGEDYFGQTRYLTTTYREAWVRKLYFSPGVSVDIELQDEPLYLNDSVFVEDSHGTKWYVTLLPRPTQ
jgi:hypothetical protein